MKINKHSKLSNGNIPRLSVITVSMNDAVGLAKTIANVINQNYENLQYIVVDGASTDGSRELIEKYFDKIDKVLIEPDAGVYHAMNKGVSLADGEWLIFMNAGDVFATNTSLSKVVASITDTTDVVYSDWFYLLSGKRVVGNLKGMNVRHQSVLYKKSLHSTYGYYVVGKRVSISDYIFFLSISNKHWTYCEEAISICDQSGISANPSHFYQRIATDLVFGKRTRLNAALVLIIHPVYHFIKRKIFRIS